MNWFIHLKEQECGGILDKLQDLVIQIYYFFQQRKNSG
jgi:hypothetical protein